MMEPLALRVDPRTRFPLIEVPGQRLALFCLPLTKVQIEYFLSDTIDRQFDRAWYRERLRANPRVTSEQLAAQNLTQAFLTDITFQEARILSHWYGQGYDLPTGEEWQQALHTFEAMTASPAFVEQLLRLPELHPRAGLLIQACSQALPAYQRMRDLTGRRLSHQLMLSPGILEYVYQGNTRTRCQACGQSFQVLRSDSAGPSTIMDLSHPEQGERMPLLGVRPVLRW